MIVYFLETQYLYREWNNIFLELVLYLKETYNAKIVHQKGDHLLVNPFQFNLSDCHLLIYDEIKDKLYGISFEDVPGNFVDIFMKRNKKDDILILSQQINRFPKDFDSSSLNFTLTPGTWYPSLSTTNYDYFYHQRLFRNEDLIDEMFYAGSIERKDVFRLRDIGLCNQFKGNLSHLQYLEESIKYKVGFSAPSIGEVCYRDFEYMAVGVPMFRLEYMSPFNPPLIPNYHYIAVDRGHFPWTVKGDREGGDEYVQAYKKRFLEVKDDKDFLNFISKNAREYYVNYSHPINRLKHLLSILQL